MIFGAENFTKGAHLVVSTKRSQVFYEVSRNPWSCEMHFFSGFTLNVSILSPEICLRFRFYAICGSRSAIVTNTTVEIVVPENVIGSVYGENGSNLARLRQISGAKVTVHEPRPGTRERIIVISGTPDETQAAQSLLQAFILTGSS
ncbi:hypothetical protein L1049_014920 [Liquidambar formosana]|uniref:K Homology domain-containing protein n=1 Tax=Liquidambar formosana TaxID=63359 RepID=A0AAP0X1E5_LIQFO